MLIQTIGHRFVKPVLNLILKLEWNLKKWNAKWNQTLVEENGMLFDVKSELRSCSSNYTANVKHFAIDTISVCDRQKFVTRTARAVYYQWGISCAKLKVSADVLFSNVIFSTVLVVVFKGMLVISYLPLAPTVPVIVSIWLCFSYDALMLELNSANKYSVLLKTAHLCFSYRACQYLPKFALTKPPTFLQCIN